MLKTLKDLFDSLLPPAAAGNAPTLAAAERFLVRADWKSGSENFCGDAYHVGTTHYSATLSGLIPGDVRETGPNARGYMFDGGHSFIGHQLFDWFGPPFAQNARNAARQLCSMAGSPLPIAAGTAGWITPGTMSVTVQRAS